LGNCCGASSKGDVDAEAVSCRRANGRGIGGDSQSGHQLPQTVVDAKISVR